MEKFHHVYQFRISLENVTPTIWRRLQVPETYTFWDFHVAIQDAMGWADTHLHEFKTVNPKTKKNEIIGIPDPDYVAGITPYKTSPGWKLNIRDYFSEENRIMPYKYDFGDNWEHCIEYECILFKQNKQKYPVCIDGERACPPEDCGGPWGYEKLLEILKDPHHENYKDMKLWVGKKFDSEKFNASKVRFDDPKIRLTNITWK